MKTLGPRSLASSIKTIFDVLFYLTVIAGALAAITMVAVPLFESKSLTQHAPVAFELDPSAYQISSEELGIDSAEMVEAHGKIRMEGVSKKRMLVALAFALLLVGVLALVLAKLREIFRTLTQGDPFVPANAGRIRFVGFAIIFGEMARAAIETGYALDAAWHFSAVGLTIRPEFEPDIPVILVGLVVIVIAEAFRLGTKLQEERELTV